MTKAATNSPQPADADRPDPLVEEIRAIKQRVSAAAGHDVRVLCTQLAQDQTTRKSQLVDRRPLRQSPTSAAV